MTSHFHLFLTPSKLVALLLSIVITAVWLGAVIAGFSSWNPVELRRITLEPVTVRYNAPPKAVGTLVVDDTPLRVAAATNGKL